LQDRQSGSAQTASKRGRTVRTAQCNSGGRSRIRILIGAGDGIVRATIRQRRRHAATPGRPAGHGISPRPPVTARPAARSAGGADLIFHHRSSMSESTPVLPTAPDAASSASSRQTPHPQHLLLIPDLAAHAGFTAALA
jgi:hypothetical protein